LVLEYFKNHPQQDLTHAPVVDWVEQQSLAAGGRKPRDTWRTIRKLSQEGILIKVNKGVYRYDPDSVKDITLFDFPPQIKEMIFKRDNYKCVICGLGKKDGVEICADHIIPLDKGGKNIVENGQTLCTKHNLIKKNYSQTEAGKRFFIKIYEKASELGDVKMMKFCGGIFDIYDKYEVDLHIPRPDVNRANKLFP
jgi:hypothetical protein